MGKSSSDPIGWRYLMTIHMGLCRKTLNELVQIKVGDKNTWSGSITVNGDTFIDKPNLFGGDNAQGGIQGTLTSLFGAIDQAPYSPLAALHGALLPAFRRVTSLVFDGLFCSNNPNPQTWTVRGRRSTAGWPNDTPWYPEKCLIALNATDPDPLNVIHAMNGAHILYETIIDGAIGQGLDAGYIDDASFRAAADTLYAEKFGLCLRWTRTDDVKSFQQSVVSHINAALGLDYATGKIVLTLIRPDYDPATLPLFDYDSGLISIEDDTSNAQEAQPNQVVVKYRDPVSNLDNQVRISNAAAITNMGKVSSETKEYPGLPTEALALQVCQRDVMTHTAGLRGFKVTLDRRGYALRPGSVFRVSAPDRNIDNMVLRCFVKTAGSLADGALTFTATQDLYGLPATTFTGISPKEHTPADHTPYPAPYQAVIEAPYRMLAQQLSAANLAAVANDAGYLLTAGVRPDGFSTNYAVASEATGDTAFVTRGVGTWCPSGVLVDGIGPTDTAITLSGFNDLDQVRLASAALLEDEIVRVDAGVASTGAITIARGCCDTVPAAHLAGARIFFFDPFAGSDQREYVSGETVQAKLITHTPSGDLAIADAPTSNVTMDQRQARPYPPGNLTINGVAYPASVIEPLAIAWSHRDRITQADQLIDTTQGDIGPEDGTTYTVRVYLNGVLDSTTAGIVGTTAAPAVSGYGPLRVEIDSVVGGLSSLQPLSASFTYLSALKITSPSSINLVDGTAGTLQLTSTGGTAPNAWASSELPDGISMDESGLLSYDGTAAVGSYSITFTETDSGAPQQTAEKIIVILVGALRWADDFSTDSLADYTSAAQGTLGTWSVASGQMMCTGGAQAILTPTGLTFADGYVEVDATYADDAGLIARVADANNYYLLRISDASSSSNPNTFTVWRCAGGTFTALATNVAVTGGWPRGTSKTFRLTLNGTTLTTTINGTVANTVTDSGISAAGGFGLRNNIGTSKFEALRSN